MKSLSFSPRPSLAVCLLAVVAFAHSALATTYYVDFESGADDKAGTSAGAAFKHSPNDPAAAGTAAGVKLEPGDLVIFKGGVVYRGMVNVTASGSAEKPITFDGNTKGDFGSGKAIIDGSEPLTGWKRCASADEAKGNPRWAEIFQVDVPSPKEWNSLNLSDAESALPIAQEPNSKDPLFQEDPTEYKLFDGPLFVDSAVKLTPGEGLRPNKQRPLILMVTKGHNSSAIIDPAAGGSFSVEAQESVTVSSLGIAPQPKYTPVKEAAFYGDGKELLKVTLERDKKEMQKFTLPQPATFKKLTVKLLSTYEGETKNYTAIREVAAYTADGKNVLEGSGSMTLTDPKNLTQPDAHYYDGMIFAFHGGPNFVFYLPVTSYDPAAHRLTLPIFTQSLYKQTRYSFFNSVRLIDEPGEYSVEPLAGSKMSRVFLLPQKLKSDQPADVGASARSSGISLQSASNIVVQGLTLRRQNGAALEARGPASKVVFRDCEVTIARGGGAVSGSKIDGMIVERCHVHHNPGHTRGIVLHTCTNAVVRDCQIVKNTATGLDYYTCSDSQVIGNTVLGHRGMHANGITFYVGCKNILVENNRVAQGFCAMTFQEIENITIRNNIFDANSLNTVIGIWPTQPIKNVQFLNNSIVRSNPNVNYHTGFFSNAKAIEGLVVRNNIIDGLFSDHNVFKGGTFSNNLYTRMGGDLKDGMLGKNELSETDVKKVFADPDKDDFRLKAGSPAIDAGIDVGIKKDIVGTKVPQGKAPDIGAYELQTK